jgi:carbamoyl-phosphate synthase large subunit
MKDKQRIVITDGSWAASLACLQSLGRMGHEVHILDADPAVATARSKYCAGHIVSPGDVQSSHYADFLIELAATGRYDWLLPISDDAVRQCSRHRLALGGCLRLALPPEDAVSTAASKRQTYEFAARHGIPIPATYFPADVDDILRRGDEVGYPCVVKLPFGAGRDGVFIVRDRRELVALCRKDPFRGQSPMIQEFVDGALHTVTGVVQNGRIASLFMCTKPTEYTIGQITAAAYSVTDPVLWERARQIVEALDWTGAIGLDFIKRADGEYLLLEVNPRFSGPVNFAYRLGIDLPRDYFRLAFGESLDECRAPGYPEGRLYRSIFPCEFLWCMANRKRPSRLLRHMLTLGAVTNIYWDDPMLMWGQITDTGRQCRAVART